VGRWRLCAASCGRFQVSAHHGTSTVLFLIKLDCKSRTWASCAEPIDSAR
jgi:hypothetical protein